ncbi:MAG: hypothetical protein LBU77_03445, partial [Clostridiales bacterium]|nr:hypothetical protein [Clostridiales bacterium]
MGLGSIKVIVLSNDQRFKTALVGGLRREPGLEVISILPDIIQAKTFLDRKTPSVILFDIESQTATSSYMKLLMETYNLKFIIVGAKPKVQFAGIGITDLMHKPTDHTPLVMQVYIRDIVKRIKGFFNNMPALSVNAMATVADSNTKLIVMGASTGGTEALPVVLSQLPANMPPILIVQHMPSVFTRQFADRIDKMSK